jgi:hypothetical protein
LGSVFVFWVVFWEIFLKNRLFCAAGISIIFGNNAMQQREVFSVFRETVKTTTEFAALKSELTESVRVEVLAAQAQARVKA